MTSELIPNWRVTAKRSPMNPERNPLIMEAMILLFFIRVCVSPRIRIAARDGKNIPADATTAPRIPFKWYPIKAAVIRTGPGVICPKAMPSLKADKVIQCILETTSCCMRGMEVNPPPKANIPILKNVLKIFHVPGIKIKISINIKTAINGARR